MSVARACKQCQERIRELEWECGRLAQLANEATARAEKAEARAEAAEEDARNFKESWDRAEARVAELMKLIDGTPCPKCDCEDCRREIARYRSMEARVAGLIKELSKFAPIRYEEMIEDGVLEREE